ncbi:P-loop containing nucleoside triphosphate hydrolase protein [Punctularia strigosozonata HHB-11173 SS5]|uniref:P-loop containing nucleoside triphosphate hydrolase protein n=1 Tax=Punctularia strigosozonata (strain HHB-11173) TaxID=741275 RepID=UPI0004416765|nr:P-loop containing nucleoside triphosphate hydrolase protein [Punctularia strigosozonata HHB-11173 SS5]EIN09552.1 P-loop containing nucleoside triphosphate hydrolase protein [Punctularia strigosozonata HHB-11173 SS5]
MGDELIKPSRAAPNASPKPTLFSFLDRRDVLLYVLPAILTSILAGAVAPFMTLTVGQSFDAFANFPLTPNPPSSAKHKLLHDVGIAALELLGLAAAALVLTSLTSCLWVCAAERNVMSLRKRVYAAVVRKEMAWFDSHMTTDETAEVVGAGGLMAQFTKETDDVRQAIATASGYIVQYLTTTIAALAIAFDRSWSLTLVLLAPVPVLVFITGLSQGICAPLFAAEREQTASAASLVDRASSAIATVKAFNAQKRELLSLEKVLARIGGTVRRSNAVWGATLGASQFVAMSMFVGAFWFGSRLVRDGDASPGDVMAVFWACLIATGNLQLAMPYLGVVAKGQSSVVSLVALADDAAFKSTRPLRGIVPDACLGEMNLSHVTFAYPSRPEDPVLHDVSIYIPARETTFIVGGSGSGKSTIAQLLLRMYTPQSGSVSLDEQDMRYLDDVWAREHVAAVSQAAAVFEGSIRENIALGKAGRGEATMAEVEDACRMALLEEFVRDLPEGYETRVGNGGTALSGGQKQRLAIARARLRDPTVLILDEATSALDAMSRVLVFEAIKAWRRNKTTIVITHDISQILMDDFVYVLKDGHLVQQGYRADLEKYEGEFQSLLQTQEVTGGFMPVMLLEEVEEKQVAEVQAAFDDVLEEETKDEEKLIKHHSIMPLRPLTTINLTSFATFKVAEEIPEVPKKTIDVIVPSFPAPALAPDFVKRPTSFSPASSNFLAFARPSIYIEDDDEFEMEKHAVKRTGTVVSERRGPQQVKSPRKRWDNPPLPELASVEVDVPLRGVEKEDVQMTLSRIAQVVWWTIPHKPLLLLGLALCLVNGAMTPIFSFLLSKLMFEVSIGAKNIATVNTYGGIVLAVTALDGVVIAVKYVILEGLAMSWVNSLRQSSYARALAQDKKWFDKPENAPVRLVQILIKDGDDARALIATVVGQILVVATMMSVGLIWAVAMGWQLTLVGLAIAPVFVGCMAVQARLVAKCELRNKRAKEDVAKVYYDAISNIRGIRAMAFENAFQSRFDSAASTALSAGVRGAFFEGCSMGVSSALIYLAEALLFYVGAVLIANGTYNYLRMVETLNLIVFSVTIGGQMMAFGDKIAKSLQATRDFHRLLELDTESDESMGTLLPPIRGPITLSNISFSYPERSDAPVLRDMNLHIKEDECVAIVGASGCGKSTVAALLQRLYEPDSGDISVGPYKLQGTNVGHLRNHISVVSQNPNLFDASVAENIAYGNESISPYDIRCAAEAANVHDFILSLPKGYDTAVGENAALISGGQAQRIQIARALARPSSILILDECTSALDSENQRAVMDAVRHAKVGRTTLIITHKLPLMKMCDRIVVLKDGRIAEEGSYEQLMERHGAFTQLASGGEWDA